MEHIHSIRKRPLGKKIRALNFPKSLISHTHTIREGPAIEVKPLLSYYPNKVLHKMVEVGLPFKVIIYTQGNII